jgi:hypothetical protein
MSTRIQSLAPLYEILRERTDGELLYAVGYALGVDIYRSIQDPLRALYELALDSGLIEDFISSLTKYYASKLLDINLLFRDTDCCSIIWKFFLIEQTEPIFQKVLKKPLKQVRSI